VEFERLASEAARRALDKQEAVLDELRSRCSVIIAASALSASFLGDDAFNHPPWTLAALALAAFVVSMAASVHLLVPRRDTFVFTLSGTALYEASTS
jgi:hypothetical protein